MNIQNETLSSSKIVIDDKNTFNAIGVDVVLNDCVIVSSVPARALSIRATLLGGEFNAKVQLNGFFWCEAHLERVSFSGRFKNNRFGHLPEYGDKGVVDSCDFSSATMIDCEFYDCNVDSLTFPKWPHLTILHPRQAAIDLEKLHVSDSVLRFFEYIELLDDDCDAIVRNCDSLTLPVDFPREELRDVVSQLPNVLC